MSDRPKWMPSEQEVNDASMAFLLARGESDVFEKLYERLGLRAQIAVLTELFRVITGDPDGFDPDIAAEIESRVNKIREELDSE